MKQSTMGLIFAAVSGAATAQAGEKLTADQLKAFYTDKTVTGVHHKRGLSRTYHGADGTVHSKSENGTERTGKWWVDEDSGMRCVRWSHKPKDFCHYLERENDGSYVLIHGKKGKRLVEIKNVEDGNQLN